MYFRKQFFICAALLSAFVYGCKKEPDKVDPLLIGNWTDGNTKYTFAENRTFGIKYLRTGITAESVLTDSIWGKFSVDNKRSNIYFEANQLTEIKQPNTTVSRKISLPVWNYKFATDSIFNYTSNSIQGQFRKIKK